MTLQRKSWQEKVPLDDKILLRTNHFWMVSGSAGAAVFEIAELFEAKHGKVWGDAFVWEHVPQLGQHSLVGVPHVPHEDCQVLTQPCLAWQDNVAGFVLKVEWQQAGLDESLIYERLGMVYAGLDGRPAT